MNRKVLVVVDSAPARQMIRYILSREKMELDFAVRCKEAEEKLKHSLYHIVIVDEEVEGFSVERLAKAAVGGGHPGGHPDVGPIPFLVLTGEDKAGDAGCFEGTITCLQVLKPYSADALLAAVHSAAP